MNISTLYLLFNLFSPNRHTGIFSQTEVNIENMKTETTSLPIEIFDLGVYQEYFYLAAFMAVLLGGIFYKFKAGNTVPQHPFKIYQDADRKANRSLQEGEVNRALGIYQEALHQIEPIAENIEEDSSSKQVAWILHKKIEELKFEMEEK